MEIEIKISIEFGRTLLTRTSGKKLRDILFDSLVNKSINQITLDFNSVDSISTSFADEAFGKLRQLLPETEMMARIKCINTGPGVFGMLQMALKGRTRRM
jgi:hypothetical protein